MTVAQKLDRLTALHNLVRVANAAKISKDSLRRAIRGDVQPRRATLAVLAQVLSVDVQWLADDSQGWPPVWRHREGNQSAIA